MTTGLTETDMIKSLGAGLVVLVALSLPGHGAEAEAEASRPWLTGVTTGTRLGEIRSIRAEAEVKVSDGTGFNTAVLYSDPQHAAFRTLDGDRSLTVGIDAGYVWQFDGTAESEAEPFVRELVLGHQFHAQILFYDRLYPEHEPPHADTFEDQPCQAVSFGDENSLRSLYYDPAGRPLGMRMHYGPEMRITIKFDQWKEVGGVTLPFLVSIDDGRAQFDYHYTDVRFNDGSLANFRAPQG